MSSLVGDVKTLVSAVTLPKRIVESIEAVSPEMQAKLNRAFDRATLETLTICRLVCKLVLAERLHVDPSDQAVEDFMSQTFDDPRIAHRVYRLYGEAQKSSDRRRRVFLASMLFGLPFSKMPDDERDRVDMAVERLVPDDVLLLVQLDEKSRSARPGDAVEGLKDTQGTRVAALIDGIAVRVATTDDLDPEGRGFLDHVFTSDRFSVDQAAFGSLLALGCIDIGQSKASQMPWALHHLLITQLGKLVIKAIQEVRAGFKAEATT